VIKVKFVYKCSNGFDTAHLAWPSLGLAAIMLTGLVTLEMRDVVATDRSDAYVPPQSPLAIVAQPKIIAEGDSSRRVDKMLARPLFSSDRRPPPDTATLVAGASISLPRLTGVVVSSAGAFGIFAGPEGGKPVVVGEGGQVGTAVVETIAPGRVVILGPGGAVVLRPVFDEKVLQVTALDVAEPSMPGYQRPQGGHRAAFWKALAKATQVDSKR
jgi:hypothetical protein